MATANKTTTKREVTRTILEVVEEKAITLTLSEREASVLARVLNHVGGCPVTTARGAAQAISAALYEASVVAASDRVQEIPGYGSPAIYF